MWHAQIPIPIADQCFSGSSPHSGILFVLRKDRRKFHDVVDEHAARRDAKTFSSSLSNLGNVRVAFEDDRREGDALYSRRREKNRIKREEEKGEGANKCGADVRNNHLFHCARVQVQLRFARACSRIGRTAQRLSSLSLLPSSLPPPCIFTERSSLSSLVYVVTEDAVQRRCEDAPRRTASTATTDNTAATAATTTTAPPTKTPTTPTTAATVVPTTLFTSHGSTNPTAVVQVSPQPPLLTPPQYPAPPRPPSRTGASIPSTPCAKLFITRRLCLPRDTTRQPIPAGERARCLKWRTLHHTLMYTMLYINYCGQDAPRISVPLNPDGGTFMGPPDPPQFLNAFLRIE
ncbi:hypothetical protein ALC56_08628 [Trachymyrmex septentrionalis]|uniref:Uncharacterized protein n=1 Tax=Trachymyrmex septentrionalis TaxID=34720 RepID=A0A195F9E8_9HYME|nr:hypothetical protein ALC56_08628 [Trachymyrmex septentrionalis]